MYKLILTTAVSFALSTTTVLAVDAHHPDQTSTSTEETGMPMDKMQDDMLKMHEQMHKILQAKDPGEREQLKQEHQKMMQEHKKRMGGGKMMGSDTMGCGGKGGMMGAPTGK
jgi:hypothetical protein